MTDQLANIARMTAALVAQDSASDSIAAARRVAIRQAVADGFTYQDIGDASGITRQRVQQLAKGSGE